MGDKTLKSATVLVTGGAGFIGSNLCEDLLLHNNKVICFDNFSTGKRKNIAHLEKNGNFVLLEGDIRNAADCGRAMKGVDIVFQQAALGSVPRSIDDPVTTNDVNVSGFLNVLVAARDARVHRLVYASSSSVYGDLQQSPKSEEVTGEPISPYAVTKIANEKYARVFAMHYGFPVIGLRYFNVYGPNQDPDSQYAAAIPLFIKALIRHKSPVVYGNGSSSRDFTYVKNIVRMNHLAATSGNSGLFGTVFNAATGKSATLIELVSTLKKLLSENDPKINDVEITFAPARKGDIPHSLASIEKARKELGYEPAYRLTEGLAETVTWYRNSGR